MTDRRPLRASSLRILSIVLAYAFFAALWILLSDRVVEIVFSDPARIMRVSTLKGWVFVAVTSLLLWGLMRRLVAPAADADDAPAAGGLRSLLLPLGLLAAAIVALTAGGMLERYGHQRRMEAARLGIIADLKTRQIADWLGERENDARYLATSRYFGESYRRWRAEGAAPVFGQLRSRLDEYRASNGFHGAALLDEQGAMLWNSHGRPFAVDPGILAAARAAAAAGQVRRFGPHRDASGRLHLDFLAPLESAGGDLPVVILHTDPEAALFQPLQKWIAPSASGEILLFRRDGDRVVFLNQLRHRPDTALRLSFPVAGSALLAARALRGEVAPDGPLEGMDYRGVPILGVVRAVPGTDWFLVAKVDRAEVSAAASRDALWICAAGLLTLLAALAGASLLLQRRRLAATLREKRAQAERLQALQLLEGISEGSGDSIFAKDLEGRYLLFNREAARVTGKRPEEVLGRDDRALFPPAEAELLLATGRRVVAEDRRVTSEEVLTTVAGTTTFLVTKGPLHDAAGRAIGHYGIARDITARKAAEDALRESAAALRENEAFTRAVLDNLPVGIAVNSVDPAVTFSYMNDNFPRFYRTTRERIADPDAFWSAVYEDPVFRDEIRKRVLEDCASGDPARMRWEEVPLTRAGEETTYVTARNTPVPGKPLMISTVWDVTERKRAEQEKARLEAHLLQAQKMESIGRLAGGVAHDFNNLLFVILGHATLALERVDPSQPLHAHLEEIRSAAERSATLTRQLLAFARRQTVAPRVLDLNDAVAGTLSLLRRLIGEDIDLGWSPRAGLWPVKIDPAQVDQLLANLCVNARDAIAGVGRVTIETGNVTFDTAYCDDHPGFLPGEYVLLAVSDDGCGMGKEVLAHLFEPFFTTKEAGRGTGLGLATVYGIVKQNDGFVNVYSEPGAGTTFRIYLRRCAEELSPASPAAAAAPPAGRGELVLLVEDEAAIRRLGEEMLQRLGYTVLAAGTPDEALRIAREHPGGIRLLVTDVVMPGMNGRELSRRLAAENPRMACLYMSGYTADVIAHHGVLDEDVRFIQKPFSAQELGWKVHEALAGGGTPASGAGGARPRRLLYVDDERPLLELVRRQLRRRGCDVTAHADPAEALAAFRRDPGAFDGVVTDLVMPGMNGFELARQLLVVRPDLPVVLTSGYLTPEDEEQARALGVRALLKPGTVEELAAAIERAFPACKPEGPGPPCP